MPQSTEHNYMLPDGVDRNPWPFRPLDIRGERYELRRQEWDKAAQESIKE